MHHKTAQQTDKNENQMKYVAGTEKNQKSVKARSMENPHNFEINSILNNLWSKYSREKNILN